MEITNHYTWQKLLGFTPKKEERKRYVPVQPHTVFLGNVPTIKEIFAKLPNNEWEMMYGVATLHPDDEFIRKTGSELARKNAKTAVFKVEQIDFIPKGYVIVYFYGNDYQFAINYSLESNHTALFELRRVN